MLLPVTLAAFWAANVIFCCGCPTWYDARRVHAHTRLSITGFCSVETKTCKPVFENASDLFHELGVRAFVRHTKTAGEGTWWRSKVGPEESWHPFVQETQRDLPKEFAEKAHRNGQKVIFYHYPRASDYYGKVKNGSWLNRDPSGKPVQGPRGDGICVNSPWREVYKQELLELVDFGADGFFFDEIPQPTQGCWCSWCREKFRSWSGQEMYPSAVNISDPLYIKLLEFNTLSVQEHYDEINRAIANRSQDVVTLVSLYKVPCANDGGDIFESTRLANATSSTAAKTEFTLSDRGTCESEFEPHGALSGHGFEDGVMITWGWALARDAASGRPPHIWAPFLYKRPNGSAPASVFAMAAYGAVANPDHSEERIPNFALYKDTYELAAQLDNVLNGTRPLRWAGVFFSENARNKFLPGNEVEAWKKVLFPTVSAWDMLVRHRIPSGIIVDWQLDSNMTSPPQHVATQLMNEGYNAILVSTSSIDVGQAETLIAFQNLGGTVQSLDGTGWDDPSERVKAEAELLANLLKLAGKPPIQLNTPAGFQSEVLKEDERVQFRHTHSSANKHKPHLYNHHGQQQARLITKRFRHAEHSAQTSSFPHAVPLRVNSTHTVVMITNDFTWIYGTQATQPKKVTGLSLDINLSKNVTVSVKDVLSGETLTPKQVGQTWTVSLPTLDQWMTIQVACSAACWKGSSRR